MEVVKKRKRWASNQNFKYWATFWEKQCNDSTMNG